jgi:hypothetical protein
MRERGVITRANVAEFADQELQQERFREVTKILRQSRDGGCVRRDSKRNWLKIRAEQDARTEHCVDNRFARGVPIFEFKSRFGCLWLCPVYGFPDEPRNYRRIGNARLKTDTLNGIEQKISRSLLRIQKVLFQTAHHLP